MKSAPPPRLVGIPRVLDVSSGAQRRVTATLAMAAFELRAVMVLCGSGPSAPYAQEVASDLRRLGARLYVRTIMSATQEQAEDIARQARETRVSLLVAVGGGRVIDTAKVASVLADLEVVSIPTSIASDSISSPIAVLQDKSGVHTSVAARMPAGVIVDTDIIASAPLGTIQAGLGDLMSNLLAVRDWRLADRRQQDSFDGYSALIAETAARPLLGAESLEDHDTVELLAKGLVLSGLAMATAGTSRPCSGAEHLISHSLDALLASEARLHGEQVALASLIASVAHGYLTRELRTVFRRCGLPTHPDHLGLPLPLVAQAVRQAPATRPSRWTVLNELDLGEEHVNAMLDEAFEVER